MKRKILIVEDNAINRAMLAEILSSEYEILEVENGKEALAVLERCYERISLILLDIVMPVMDGYTFLDEMKKEANYASIPVVIVTQKDTESEEIAALSHGATEFIVKPYRPQVILHRAASIIKLREDSAMVHTLQHDRLTGLYNRDYFFQYAKKIIQENPEKKYDIACADIENFKLINDEFGVQTGDRLLCDLAAVIQMSQLENSIFGRLYADHFVTLMEHQEKYPEEWFTRANEKIRELSGLHGVVINWGIYREEGENLSIEQMCDRALQAAQRIKGEYGVYSAYYDKELRDTYLREQMIVSEMETALEERQFQVYYQPKYKVKSGRMESAEALDTSGKGNDFPWRVYSCVRENEIYFQA